MFRTSKVAIATDTNGAATVYSEPFVGLLYGFVYVPGTLDTGTDLTITDEATGAALLTVTNAGTSIVPLLPRGATAGITNAAALYAAGGTGILDLLPVAGRVKVVVAQGASTKAGSLWVFWQE